MNRRELFKRLAGVGVVGGIVGGAPPKETASLTIPLEKGQVAYGVEPSWWGGYSGDRLVVVAKDIRALSRWTYPEGLTDVRPLGYYAEAIERV